MTIYKWSRYTENTIINILRNKRDKVELLILMDKPWDVEENELQEILEGWNVFDWEVKVYKQKDDGCINWLWNKIPELASNEKIFVINDDIEVSPEFDEVIENMGENEILNPYFISPNEKGIRRKDNNISWHAWATTKKVLKKVLPIDKRIKLWYWDDRIYKKCLDQWIEIKWTSEIRVFHYESQTLNNPEVKAKADAQIKKDMEQWKEILKEQKRQDLRFPNNNEEFNKTSWSSEK